MTTSIINGTIMGQAKAFDEARQQWDAWFLVYYKHSIPPLAPEFFWPIVDKFRDVLLKTASYRGVRDGQAAAEEFMRLAVSEELVSLEAAIHFALSWRHYKDKAYAAGGNSGFSWERGDDGFGDLMDSLPLASRDVYDKLVAGEFKTLQEFNNSVDSTFVSLISRSPFDSDPTTIAAAHERVELSMAYKLLIDVVLYGENYFSMFLEKAAQNWIVAESRRYFPKT